MQFTITLIEGIIALFIALTFVRKFVIEKDVSIEEIPLMKRLLKMLVATLIFTVIFEFFLVSFEFLEELKCGFGNCGSPLAAIFFLPFAVIVANIFFFNWLHNKSS